MQKRTIHRMNTVALALLFLIGLLLVIWPVATELSSYQTDDEEYGQMAAEVHPQEPTPVPPFPAITETGQPKEESTETVTLASDGPVMAVTDVPVSYETDQPSPVITDVPVVTIAPTLEPTIVPLHTATVVPVTVSPDKEPTTAPVQPTKEPPPSKAPSGADLDACLKQNKDFVAWLTIPGTKIDYPVVRSNNTEYYLHHLFTGKESKLGCLFSLKSSDYELPSKNIAIYGHHLSNSTAMFSTLLKYKSKSYCDSHGVIHLDSLYGERDYQVFAVVNMNVSDWDTATASFTSNEGFLRFVNRARKAALYETDVQVMAEDHILTLITCDRSYSGASGRLIVMAVQE